MSNSKGVLITHCVWARDVASTPTGCRLDPELFGESIVESDPDGPSVDQYDNSFDVSILVLIIVNMLLIFWMRGYCSSRDDISGQNSASLVIDKRRSE